MKYKRIVSCLLVGGLLVSNVGAVSADDVSDLASPVSDVGWGKRI